LKDVSWDGDLSGWPDFARRLRLVWDGTKKKNRRKLGPKVVQRLRDKAWDATVAIDNAKLRQHEG